MNHPSIRFQDVSPLAMDRWPDILIGLGVDSSLLTSLHGPCPGCGGRDRFRFDNKDGRGTFICGGGGEPLAGDGFELLRHVYGWSKREVLNRVAEYLGITDLNGQSRQCPSNSAPKIAKPTNERYIEQKRKKIKNLWESALPISADDPVARYLRARGLHLSSYPSTLRYHPALPYWHLINGTSVELGKFPAMLAAVQAPDDRCVGLHRTYLNFEGGKANIFDPNTGEVLPVKKLCTTYTKACRGAAIRLFPASTEMAVTEGIETALAVNEITGRPTWACLNATCLRLVELNPSIKDVLIAADNDLNQAGQNAARKLELRLTSSGINARTAWPNDEGSDWLDALNKYGVQIKL